jgi:hypothetical protein
MPLSPKDITSPAWRAAIAAARGTTPAKPARAARFTGDHSRRKAWVREMDRGPGIFAPMYLPNPSNTREHVMARARRAKRQRDGAATLAYVLIGKQYGSRAGLPPRVLVTLTRYGTRPMDSDGLVASLKHVRDGVADAVGIDDGRHDLIRFVAVQELARFAGVRIEIGEMTP